MAKAVFTCKPDSIYDDKPEERYHFPERYLSLAKEAVGDWIVYYEPRRGGRQVYFATARIREVVRDPATQDHYYAIVSPGEYVEFVDPVPFRTGPEGRYHYYESALVKEDGSANKGRFGWSVRILPEAEYQAIVQAGMAPALEATGAMAPEGVAAEAPPVPEPLVVEKLITPAVRDWAFGQTVNTAYDSTCALTGLRLLDGQGRREVEAAHIRARAEGGPDSPRNGVALSRTVHWLFARGLLSLEDDGKMLVVEKHVAPRVRALLHPNGYAKWPDVPNVRPHPEFLKYHRERVFVG